MGALAGRLGISDAAVSQHLQILRKAGLLTGEKRGCWTHYIVDRDMLGKVEEDCGNLRPCPQAAKRDARGKLQGKCIIRRGKRWANASANTRKN